MREATTVDRPRTGTVVRAWAAVMGVIAALAPLTGAAEGASELGRRYPAGAIRDRAVAEQALRAAEDEEARIERESAAREAECYRGFLVNRCREEVRRDRLDAERELRRVRIEARDVQRRLDAEEAAQRRAAATRPATPEKPAEPAERPGAEAPRISPEDAARNRAAYEKRIADHRKELADEQARAAERDRNAREYREKQAEAERRASEKDAERRKNEERRAERRKQMEAQEARREEIRRKAEEAARAAGKGS